MLSFVKGREDSARVARMTMRSLLQIEQSPWRLSKSVVVPSAAVICAD